MDAKITKVRLSRMLSYDWLKIVASALALIFFWVLLFTMTATKVASSQQFILCNYLGNVSFQKETSPHLVKQLQDGKLTYEIIEVNMVDLATAQDAASQLLEARTTTDELDLMFVSMQPDTRTAYEQTNEAGEKETLYKRTYLQTFLGGYFHKLHNLSRTAETGYFMRLEGYLNEYYTNGYLDDSVLDTAKIEADFRARTKKDKRYKTEAEIQKGIAGDIARVQAYRNALISFDRYLADGVVEIVNSVYLLEDGSDYFQGNGTYSINICKTEKTSSLYNYVGYETTFTDENGKEQYKVSAENMNVCLFNSNGKQDAHAFEGLVYLTSLLDTLTAS